MCDCNARTYVLSVPVSYGLADLVLLAAEKLNMLL